MMDMGATLVGLCSFESKSARVAVSSLLCCSGTGAALG